VTAIVAGEGSKYNPRPGEVSGLNMIAARLTPGAISIVQPLARHCLFLADEGSTASVPLARLRQQGNVLGALDQTPDAQRPVGCSRVRTPYF
jgi:hypothetical protein